MAASDAAYALGQAAETTAVVVLHVPNKAVEQYVQNQMGLAASYAKKVVALIEQARTLLSGRGSSTRDAHAAAYVTPAQQRKAGQLIKQAQRCANKESQAAQNAQELVASVASPPGQVGRINTSVKKILARLRLDRRADEGSGASCRERCGPA